MNFGQAVSYIADRYGWDVFPLTENSDIGKNDIETARAVRTVLKGTQNGRKADYVTDEELKQCLVKTTKLTDLARKYGFTTAEFKAFLKKRGFTWEDRAKDIIGIEELSRLCQQGYTQREIAAKYHIPVGSVKDLCSKYRYQVPVGEPVISFKRRVTMIDNGVPLSEVALSAGMTLERMTQELRDNGVVYDFKISRNGLASAVKDCLNANQMMRYFGCTYVRLEKMMTAYGMDVAKFRKDTEKWCRENCETIHSVAYQLGLSISQAEEIFPGLVDLGKESKHERKRKTGRSGKNHK